MAVFTGLQLATNVFSAVFIRAKLISSYLREMVHVSVEEAVKAIRREFRDLTNQEFHTGIARAINHTLGKTKTASSQGMRLIYNLSARDVGKALSITKASRGQLYGMLVASGRPLPLILFKPSQNGQGVSIMVKKGQRQQIRGAFLKTMGSGHQGIFARGKHEGGDFGFRHKRTMSPGGYVMVNGRYRPKNNDLSIGELTTLSMPKAFSNAVVLRQVERQISEDFPNRMMHELQRMR